jgi:hypothetical protein
MMSRILQREEIARAVYPSIVRGGNYGEVPMDEAFRRPRHQHLRERTFEAADRILALIEPQTASAEKAEALLAEAGEALASWHNLVKTAPIDEGDDPLEGLPDSHLFELQWTDDVDVPEVKTITAGQIRRASAVLAKIKEKAAS